jgi:membrane protein
VTGFVVLLVGASGVFGELQDSLNQIWGASSKRHPVFTLVKERIFSFSMVFVMGFLLLVSLMFSAAVAVAGGRLHARFPDLDGPWAWGNDVISLIVVALLFAMIFRLVPDVPITWKDVWLGAVISAVLFELGRFLLGFYFGRSALAANYGAAGSLIIILVWVYYTAQILFFGAAFTRVYSLSQGSHQNDDKLTSAA